MSYKIVTSSSIDDLVVLVNEHLEKGYQPIGGFQLVKDRFAQTLYSTDKSATSKEEQILFNKLKNKRKELADSIGAPAYVVATNRMLESLVSVRPKRKEDLNEIYGFSEQKIKLYGDIFLDILNE